MKDVLAFTFPGGRLVSNFATLGAVATISFTVPAGKRWIFIMGRAERDQAATFDVTVTDGTNDIILGTQVAAGTTQVRVGSLFATLPIVMDAGWVMTYDWGAAQTTPEVTCVVLELDV